MNRSSNNKGLGFIIFFGLLVVGVGIGTWIYRSKRSQSGNRTGKVVKDSLIQRITIAGGVKPLRSTIVTAPYDGYVKKLYVKIGQPVKAGDPLTSISQSLAASENVFPIRAPFTGVVTQVLKTEGQFAKQNDATDFVLRMDDLSKMFIDASAPEIDVVKIKVGLEANIKVSAILSRNYKGIVREISQAPMQKEQWGGRSQVEYLVKIEVLDADAELKPGMSSIVDIVTHKKDNVLTLRHEFIQREDGEYFVIMKDGQRMGIKVALQNESVFEVTDGLNEGQEVRQIDFLKLVENQK